jgi:hypothetical protein
MAGVETIIMHESGEWIANEFLLKCAKNDPQGMGSAITYARRYGLQAAAGVPSEDDDGEGAMQRKKPSKPAQSKQEAIEKLAAAKDIDELSAAWTSLSAENKQNSDVIGLKDARKAELQPTK